MHEPPKPDDSRLESQVEPDEVDAGLLGVVGTFIAVVVVLIVVLLQAWFYNWRGNILEEQALPAGGPETPLGQAMLEQQAHIGSYHWVNREAGIRAIPIDRAMEVLAREMAAHNPPVKKVTEKEGKP